MAGSPFFLGSQPCFFGLSLVFHFLLFQGPSQVSSLLQVGVLLPHCPPLALAHRTLFYPFALAGFGTPFLQGVLYFSLSVLPLPILMVTRRPQLSLLSTVLIPQTWLVCPTSLLPLLLPYLLAVHHTPGMALSAGATRMKEAEPGL